MLSFRQLFAGRTDCYGTYKVSGDFKPGEKHKGRADTKRAMLTDDLYQKHLDGKIMLGVVPIRLDGTVSWFAGDVDIYNGFDHKALELKCQKLEIPFVICRTKSGGAHLYAFLKEPIPAADAIKLGKDWLEQLGFGKSEFFPKQAQVTDQSFGNWINLPYFNAANPLNYAIGINGEKLTLSQFEQLAFSRTITTKDVQKVFGKPKTKPKEERDPLNDAPPCIVAMINDGVNDGQGRHNALVQFGIYYHKSVPDKYKEKMAEANQKHINPPIGHEEFNQTVKNLPAEKYQYLCKSEPMCSRCDKKTCLTRKWGVGPQQGVEFDEFDIERVIKINSDPPIYLVSVNGMQVSMTTEQLYSARAFPLRLFESIGLVIKPPTVIAHQKMLIELRGKTEIEEAPDEVSDVGLVKDVFLEWTKATIARSRSISDVNRGHPYYDADDGYVFFKATTFIDKVKSRRTIADRKVWQSLRESGAERANVKIDGKQTNVWRYPVDLPWFELPNKDKF